MYNLLQRLIFKVLRLFVPQIEVLNSPINWKHISDFLGARSSISEKAKISSPFRIINSVIGDYSYVDYESVISNTDIGKFCSIGPRLSSGWGIHPTEGISTSPMFYSNNNQNNFSISKTQKIEERKRIRIGNDVFIGMNVTILDGVTIGDGAVIGAGAVVSKDIPPYAVAVGSPIKVVKYRFNADQIEKLKTIRWWDRPEILEDVERMFFDIDAFIVKYASTKYNNY